MDEGVHVIKLGGSLLDMADLLMRFEAYRQTEAGRRALLIVGGGRPADAVRHFDASHKLGPERGHWLAVQAMQLNAHMLAAVLDRVKVVGDEHECCAAWEASTLAVMDPLEWLRREESRGMTIPHRWSFTSDSIAAHVANQLGASRLTMLKSTSPSNQHDLQSLASKGVVDDDFFETASGLPLIEIVNLRAQPWTRCAWRSPA